MNYLPWNFLFLSWGVLRLFQLYHGTNSLVRDPWLHKPVLCKKMYLAQGHSIIIYVRRFWIEPVTPGSKSPTLTIRPRQIWFRTPLKQKNTRQTLICLSGLVCKAWLRLIRVEHLRRVHICRFTRGSAHICVPYF